MRRLILAVLGAIAALLAIPGAAWGHGREGHPPTAATILSAWSLEPWVVVPLALAAVLYGVGLTRLWRDGGGRRAVRGREVAAWVAGWLALVVALVSPLDRLGATLFSAHMAQHEMLMLVAAPLLVLGRPVVAVWGLPAPLRRPLTAWTTRPAVERFWRTTTAGATVWILHALALWIWHLPSLYQATLRSDAVHAAQHLSFFLTAALFWWGIVHGRWGRLGYGAGVLFVFTTAGHSGLLGALITVAPRLWYPIYAARTAAWGLSPLEDQQLAGLFMWIPAGVLLTVLALALVAAWIGEAARRGRVADEAMRRAIAAPAPRPATVVTAGPLALACLAVLALAAGGCDAHRADHARAITGGGDPDRGKLAIARRGCGGCHQIPGVDGAAGTVGPPLSGIGRRGFLAGHLRASPENLQAWIRHPQQVEPGTAMPELGVGAAEARDIAAYLYTLR